MSKHVHCPECNSENTVGSKFCNHCGARLPKSTSVLCPRCQTPNPHNNFYCDNCGSRLRSEQSNIQPEEEPKKEASDLPTSAKMFSLPTREPGDTGELDPDKLPEWLKNQSEEPGKKEKTGKLPRLSDLTPEERGTAADLPGWLVNTDNEELLIDSPDDITTEHFLHLIQDINEEEREKLSGLLSDPTIAGDAANLPDWLKDVAQATPKETPSPAAGEESAAAEDVSDWLSDLDSSDAEKPPADVSDSMEPAFGMEDPDAVPDWLGELGPPRTAMLGKSEEEELPAAKPKQELESGDLPDWLTQAEQPSDEAQATEDIFSDAGLIENDVPDWLLGDEPLEDTQPDDIPTEEATLEDLTLDTAAATSLTGWLAEFDTDDMAEETAVSETPEQATPPEELPADDTETQRSLTNWLTAFDEEDLIPDENVAEVAQSSPEEPLPDWLTGVDEAVEAAALAKEYTSDDTPSEEDTVDWISDFDDEEESPTPPTAETPITEDDSFDWLSDFDGLSDEEASAEEPIVTETPPQTPDDSFDWLSDELESTEITTGSEDILELDVSTDSSLSTGDTGPLPDWLDDLGPMAETSSQFDSSELDSSLDDLLGEAPKGATGELTWLEDESVEEDEIPEEIETESDDSAIDALAGALGAAAVLGAASEDADDATVDYDSDWLSELADFDPSAVIESADEVPAASTEQDISELQDLPFDAEGEEFDIEAVIGATEDAESDEFDMDEAFLGVAEQEAGDWADIDGILAGKAEEEALPDWLEQLDGVTESEIEAFETGEEPPEEIPDWVANMRPGDTGQLSSVLPSALFTDSDASELLKDTGDLADADLPDWLDETIDQRVSTAEKEAMGWLDTGEADEDAPSELEALLADLPPAQAPEDMLLKAEIPDWLEELKPRELTGEAAPAIESRLESSGPLAGMPNTIAVEPIIAMPRAASKPSTYTISPEQIQQAILLRQIVQEGPQPPKAATTRIGARGIAGLRIFVAILLLAAIALGLYGPEFLKSKAPIEVPVPATAMNTAVSRAAGKTVLVAFEYTPALAGELNHEAETLLTQINAIGSPILTTSQYVAGTAVAESQTAPFNANTLGLIPGEAMGLRQLGTCLGEAAFTDACKTLNNIELSNAVTNDLGNVGLIVVLTGERSSLVNWVEQVGAVTDIPIVVGSTQSLEPLVAPYFASAQVEGYLNGLPATVAYQQAYIQLPDSSASDQYGAQSLVLLTAAVILLVGGLALSVRRKKS